MNRKLSRLTPIKYPSHTDILFDVLQNKTLDVIFCIETIEDIKDEKRNVLMNSGKVRRNFSEQPKRGRNEMGDSV